MGDERGRAWRRALQSVGMTANCHQVAEILEAASHLSDDDLAELVALVELRLARRDMQAEPPTAERLN